MSPRIERLETSSNGEGKLSITAPPHQHLESTAAGYRFTFTESDVGEWINSLLPLVQIEMGSPTYEQTVEVVAKWARSHPRPDYEYPEKSIDLFLSHAEAELVKGHDHDVHIRFASQEAVNATALALLPELSVDLEGEPRIFGQICAQLGLAEEPRIKEALSLVPTIVIEAALNIKAKSDDNAETRLARVLEELALFQQARKDLNPLEETLGLSPSSDASIIERIGAIVTSIEDRFATRVSQTVEAVLDALEIRLTNLTIRQQIRIDDNLQAQDLPRVVRK